MKLKNKITMTVASLFAVLNLAVVPMPAVAQPGDVQAAVQCGYYIEGYLYAHYLHCTSQPYAVMIDANFRGSVIKDWICVQPNEDRLLGFVENVWGAWYNGKLC
jgi:hypothetical protein